MGRCPGLACCRAFGPQSQDRKSAAAGDDAAVEQTERDIDEIVHRLFDLTAAEVTQIETALANTRGQSSDDDADVDE